MKKKIEQTFISLNYGNLNSLQVNVTKKGNPIKSKSIMSNQNKEALEDKLQSISHNVRELEMESIKENAKYYRKNGFTETIRSREIRSEWILLLLKEAEIYAKLDDVLGQALSLDRAGGFYANIDNYREASNNLHKAADLYLKIGEDSDAKFALKRANEYDRLIELYGEDIDKINKAIEERLYMPQYFESL